MNDDPMDHATLRLFVREPGTDAASNFPVRGHHVEHAAAQQFKIAAKLIDKKGIVEVSRTQRIANAVKMLPGTFVAGLIGANGITWWKGATWKVDQIVTFHRYIQSRN